MFRVPSSEFRVWVIMSRVRDVRQRLQDSAIDIDIDIDISCLVLIHGKDSNFFLDLSF